MLSLQLTLVGAVFGFAISQKGMIVLLLIVPFSSYLLCGRLVAQHFAGQCIGQYITEELSHRINGNLGWEQWLRKSKRYPHFLGSTFPLLLTFSGASLLALAWVVSFVFLGNTTHVGIIVLWFLGLAVAAASTILVLQMAGRLPARSWEHTNLS